MCVTGSSAWSRPRPGAARHGFDLKYPLPCGKRNGCVTRATCAFEAPQPRRQQGASAVHAVQSAVPLAARGLVTASRRRSTGNVGRGAAAAAGVMRDAVATGALCR